MESSVGLNAASDPRILKDHGRRTFQSELKGLR